MSSTVHVTGTFKDLAQRPLKGTIEFRAVPEYVIDKPDETLFAGLVTAELDDAGKIDIDLMASVGWKYKITFELRTQDGEEVTIRDTYAEFPSDASLPDHMFVEVTPGSSQPQLSFTGTADSGTVAVSGAMISPTDPGAIIIPINV